MQESVHSLLGKTHYTKGDEPANVLPRLLSGVCIHFLHCSHLCPVVVLKEDQFASALKRLFLSQAV